MPVTVTGELTLNLILIALWATEEWMTQFSSEMNMFPRPESPATAGALNWKWPCLIRTQLSAPASTWTNKGHCSLVSGQTWAVTSCRAAAARLGLNNSLPVFVLHTFHFGTSTTSWPQFESHPSQIACMFTECWRSVAYDITGPGY